MKDRIREFALEAGADDVGFASVADYRSPLSPPVEGLLPGARSLVVFAYRELSSCESPNPLIAMNGRMDLMEFSRSLNYKVARFVERETGAATVTVPISYPLKMSEDTKGVVGELSLRHAAVAAGLGAFGKNNLVLHPRLGSRVLFTALATRLDLAPDKPLSEPVCIDCGLCVKNCPGRALDVEGQTDAMKCLKHSQPYGLGADIRFWSGWADAPSDQRKAMLRDTHYWRLYQAGFIGFQYVCWNCMSTCPVGRKKAEG